MVRAMIPSALLKVFVGNVSWGDSCSDVECAIVHSSTRSYKIAARLAYFSDPSILLKSVLCREGYVVYIWIKLDDGIVKYH